MEADPEKQKDFLEEISSIDSSKLVYIDESGVRESLIPLRGWALAGTRSTIKQQGKRSRKVNVIGAYTNHKHLATCSFESNCNTDLFNTWLSDHLLPQLQKGAVIIMDNARFHKSRKTKDLIEEAGCKLKYLPPYSPELNPIEKGWANMKNWLRKRLRKIGNIMEALELYFKDICQLT